MVLVEILRSGIEVGTDMLIEKTSVFVKNAKNRFTGDEIGREIYLSKCWLQNGILYCDFEADILRL